MSMPPPDGSPPKETFWSAGRIDTLKDGVSKGLTYSRIASLIGGGCTRNMAVSKAHRLGIGGDGTRATVNRPPRPPRPPKPPTVSKPSIPPGEALRAREAAFGVLPADSTFLDRVNAASKASPDHTGVPFFENKGGCPWVMTEDVHTLAGAPIIVCGRKSYNGPWCDHHAKFVFNTEAKAWR